MYKQGIRFLLIFLLVILAGCAKPLEADRLFGESLEVMKGVDRYAIRMQLNQALVHEGTQEKLKVNSEGTVSLDPLMMEQTVRSDYDGDVTEMKTILAPDAYYIHDTTIGIWNKLPKSEIASVRGALSDFQVDPHGQMERMRKFADSFKVEKNGGQTVLTLTEKDNGAKELLNDILKSTLNGGQLSKEANDSIAIGQLNYKATLDAKTNELIRLDVVSDMKIEFEPGVPMSVNQTLAVNYGEFNSAAKVAIPQEAKDAPEIMGPDDGGGLEPVPQEELYSVPGAEADPEAGVEPKADGKRPPAL
jgi:hypothetical protein